MKPLGRRFDHHNYSEPRTKIGRAREKRAEQPEVGAGWRCIRCQSIFEADEPEIFCPVCDEILKKRSTP